MSAIFEDITAAIGFTPLVKLNRLAPHGSNVLVKCESLNPCHSVKDRIALYMINAAEQSGKIDKDTLLVEPTSGNTGIGLAFICASRGYKLILTMPESMSVERRKLLQMFGAQLILTPADKGMSGAVAIAEQIVNENSNALLLQQFRNPANPQAHRETTAIELWNDTDGNIDIIVSAVGTGGTLTGCGQALKQKNPNLKMIAVEPVDSPVLSGGKPGSHKIQGIGAGFIPDVLDRSYMDEVMTVTAEDALNFARRLASEEGILAGISAGANVWAAIEVAKRPENTAKTIVTFICDTGERYLSTDLFTSLPEPKYI